jgi:hypothetical protein
MILGEPMKTKIRKEIFEGVSFFDSLSRYRAASTSPSFGTQDILFLLSKRLKFLIALNFN